MPKLNWSQKKEMLAVAVPAAAGTNVNVKGALT
jgi:hypothetical protein